MTLGVATRLVISECGAGGSRNAVEAPGSRISSCGTLEGCQSATLPGSRGDFGSRSGGVVALNPRLMAGKPPACSRPLNAVVTHHLATLLARTSLVLGTLPGGCAGGSCLNTNSSSSIRITR